MAGYDEMLGDGYAAQRRPDPRIAAQIRAALGDARRVVNVGAGAGSYEPADLDVVAVEPSEVMRAQRPIGAASRHPRRPGPSARCHARGAGTRPARLQRRLSRGALELARALPGPGGAARHERLRQGRRPTTSPAGLARLERDLRSGAWAERHSDLLTLGELDLGYRLLVAGSPSG